MEKKKDAIVVSFYNFKGGIGKTTLSVSFAAAKASDPGTRVLFIDMETQCNASRWLGYTKEEMRYENGKTSVLNIPGIKHKGIPQVKPTKLFCPAPNYHLYAIRGSLSLEEMWGKETELDGKIDVMMPVIDELRPLFDYIVIDLGTRYSDPTLSALCASDYVIVPVTPDTQCLEGLETFMEDIYPACKTVNPLLEVAGLVHNMLNVVGYSIYTYAVALPAMAEKYGVYLYKSAIHTSAGIANLRNPSVIEKAGTGRNLCLTDKFIYRNYPKAYEDFKNFMKETDKRIRDHENQ